MGVFSAVQRLYRRVSSQSVLCLIICTRHSPERSFLRSAPHSHRIFAYLQQSEPDYETILSSLETKVKARESHLLQIKLRERRANALFITYGLGLWALYSVLWYALLLHRRHGFEGVVVALPVFVGPVL